MASLADVAELREVVMVEEKVPLGRQVVVPVAAWAEVEVAWETGAQVAAILDWERKCRTQFLKGTIQRLY